MKSTAELIDIYIFFPNISKRGKTRDSLEVLIAVLSLLLDWPPCLEKDSGSEDSPL